MFSWKYKSLIYNVPCVVTPRLLTTRLSFGRQAKGKYFRLANDRTVIILLASRVYTSTRIYILSIRVLLFLPNDYIRNVKLNYNPFKYSILSKCWVFLIFIRSGCMTIRQMIKNFREWGPCRLSLLVRFPNLEYEHIFLLISIIRLCNFWIVYLSIYSSS